LQFFWKQVETKFINNFLSSTTDYDRIANLNFNFIFSLS